MSCVEDMETSRGCRSGARQDEAGRVVEVARREAAAIIASAQEQARAAVAAEIEKIKAKL